MIRLGSIAVQHAPAIREARNKVRLVTESLTNDSVTATRLATVTSEMAKLLLREATEGRLDISIESQDQGHVLALGFADRAHLPAMAHLATFFDAVEGPHRVSGEHVVRGILHLPKDVPLDESRIASLEAIVQQKSRDELMAEVQAKNLELQESLDNLRRTRSAKERMESELNIGREIQMSMLPLSFPAFPDRKEFDVHAALHPAREVGGDFYDMFLIDRHHFCFCVGDVSGKGVPAALFMAVTKTLIKSRAANDFSPASILSHVNTELSKNNDSCMFVTVFLGILDLRTGEAVYSNAGHNPPYVQRIDGEILRLDERHGPIVGAVEGIAYREDNVSLEPRDLLFLYTDGVTEAMNIEQQLYSEDRLRELVASQRFDSAEEAVKVGVDDVWRFQGDAEQADDVTVMAVVYSGSAEQTAVPQLTLAAANRLEEIDRVNEAFNAFAEEHAVPVPFRRKLNLVFDELMNNIISYAYDDDDEHIIDVHISLTDDLLSVTITDDGKAFNPFEGERPDTTLSVSDRPIGGLGVHLVKSLMDDVSYERRGDKNVVILKKQIESSEE